MAFNKARALQEAQRFLSQGKIAEAAKRYVDVVENDPSDLAVINIAGDLCVRAGNVPEALRLFRRLAESYAQEGYGLRAIAIYKKVLKLDAANVDGMLRLAGLYSQQGLAREARDLYAQALVVCQDRKLQDKALEVMRRIAADEPANVAHRLRLAELSKAAGREEDAFKTYLEATEVALAQSDSEVATIALDEAAALRPGEPRLREFRLRLGLQAPAAEEPVAVESAPETATRLPDSDQPEPPVPEAGPPLAEELEQAEPDVPESSELDLSDEWESAVAGQAAPGFAGFDFDDVSIEIDFYLSYGMPEKARERLDEIEQQLPGDPRLAEMRHRLEESSAGEPVAPQPDRAIDLEPGWAPAELPAEGVVPRPAGGPRLRPDFAASLGQLVNELGLEAAPHPSENDPQIHFELGVAFREMGLVDEAVGELQKALRGARPAADRKRFLSACSLLALCFVEKKMPALAAKWYTRALEVPGLDPDAILALQYDLGVAYELAGNFQAARDFFLEVYGQNIEYRDVAQKIRQLAPSQ
jgi:tetratricopeptide (TPR) repeat protein